MRFLGVLPRLRSAKLCRNDIDLLLQTLKAKPLCGFAASRGDQRAPRAARRPEGAPQHTERDRKGSRSAEQDKGRRPAPKARAGGAKKRWILFAKPKTNHRWPQQSIFRNKFCAAGSGISFRRRRPDGLWSRGARPAGACGTA